MKKGFVVLSSEKKEEFLSAPKYMQYKGFETVDTANPYFEPTYLPFDKNADKPRFKKIVGDSAMKKGFTTYYTNQRHFTVKHIPLRKEMAKARNAAFETTHIRTKEDAQNAPTPFAMFSHFYNGEFITHEILSEKKFEKILAGKGL